MAVTITENVVDGSRFSISPQGFLFTRIFTVEGLDPADGRNPFFACTLPGIPPYGSFHEGITGIVVFDVNAEPLMPNAKSSFRTTVRYANPERVGGIGATIVEICGSNSLTTIQRWPVGTTPGGTLDGAPIIIGYAAGSNAPRGNSLAQPIDPATVPAGRQLGFAYDSQVKVPRLSPNTILRFTRQVFVNNVPGQGPLSQSVQYRAKVNSSSWQGGDAGTWLCRTFDFRSLGTVINGNALYENVVEFEYNPLTWDSYVVWVNSDDGKAPADVNIRDGSNNGWVRVPYPTADFAGLQLPLVF